MYNDIDQTKHDIQINTVCNYYFYLGSNLWKAIEYTYINLH